MTMSSVRFIQYIFINDMRYVLTSSIFSSDVLIVSADYLHHLQPNAWDPFDKSLSKLHG